MTKTPEELYEQHRLERFYRIAKRTLDNLSSEERLKLIGAYCLTCGNDFRDEKGNKCPCWITQLVK